MKVLLLSTDELTEQFDRRILDLSKCIIDNGGQVVIQTHGTKLKVTNIQNQTVIQIPRTFNTNHAKKAREAFFNDSPISNISTPSTVKNSKNLARALLGKLPKRLKHLAKSVVYKMYGQIKFLTMMNRQNSIPKSMSEFYFSAAYELWDANQNEKYDLIIGTDIPSSIAASLLAANPNQSWWYEAHEFATEQQWLRENVGFTEELVVIEKYLVRNADFFSSVSAKLVTSMEKTFGRTKKSFVLHNSTQATSSDAKSDELLPQQVLDVFNSSEKILLFHGVLSDLRGLSKFVKIFEDTPDSNWKLVLIGYNPGNDLLKVMRKTKKTYLLSPVSGTEIKKVVGMSDLVLMAYPVNDINTKYGFANKLGDCIAEKVPFLYNKELEAIDDVAQKTNSGISFLWPELTFPGKLQSLLDEVENMSADWERAEKLFGWTNFETTIVGLLTEIKKEI